MGVGEGGQKLRILHSKKTTKRGGGGQKLPILRRNSWALITDITSPGSPKGSHQKDDTTKTF